MTKDTGFTAYESVKCVDGFDRNMIDLKVDYDNELRPRVHTYDENQQVVRPGELSYAGVTGSFNEFVRIDLNDNSTIQATPDQVFMLTNGKSLPADELTAGDELLPVFYGETDYHPVITRTDRIIYDDPIEVYSLEVPEYKNYCIRTNTSGVIVHQ